MRIRGGRRRGRFCLDLRPLVIVSLSDLASSLDDLHVEEGDWL